MGKKKNTVKNISGPKNAVIENAYKGSVNVHNEKALYSNILLHIFLIAFVTFIAYSNSFNVPFTFDDKFDIVENQHIDDIGHYLKQVTREPWRLSSRFIGYFSFAINYKLHEFNVVGYHVLNFIIHILTSMLLYFFIIYTLKTPFLNDCLSRKDGRFIAFASSLFFAIHPLQTQAVTYIIQRFALLSAFFYLLAVFFYIKWRLIEYNDINYNSNINIKKPLFYFLCFFSILLAMKSKENALTLPLVILLYELIFFKGDIKRRLLKLIPLIITIIVIPLSNINFRKIGALSLNNLDHISRMQTDMSRWDYLFTQFRVIVTYLRLLVFPVNQNVDYDYPVYHSFFIPEVFLSFLFLLLIIFTGFYVLIRYRTKYPFIRVFSFGIFWFFITISVESSIIPIVDVIFEHRVYLPSMGFFTAVTIAIFSLIYLTKEEEKRKQLIRIVFIIFGIIVFILILLTYSRNSLWNDTIKLWEDNVEKSPNKARPYYSLGNAYFERGLIDNAIKYYQIAINLKNNNASYYYNLGNAYIRKNLIDEAIKQFETAVRINPKHAGAYNNLGNAYILKGMLGKAIESYESSLNLKPNNLEAIGNLGNIYLHQGLTDKAIENYMKILKEKPNNANAHFNLAIAYLKKKENDKALIEFQNALKLNPDMKEAKDYIDYISKMK